MACVFAVSLFGCKITTSEPDKFTIAFDANGGSGSIESITKTENEEFELPANTFTRTGYTFSSWNTKATPDESSKSYKDKEKITLTEDLTLYAQWAAGTGIVYKVEHWQQNIADDGYTLAKTEPMTGTTGEETAAKAEETVGFTAKEFAQAKIAADGSTVVKIYYDRKIITLTFDADNGEDKTTISERFDAEIVPPVPEKEDFIFTGWSIDKIPNESSKSYKDKEKITLTENLTLYAQWEENPSYFINYNLNEGTNPDDAKTSYKQDETVVLPVPTRELYDFAGWYPAQDFSGEIITGWNVGEKNGDITLYAKWSVTVKAENIVNIIENLQEGTHNICVVGEIDETTLMNIGEALRSNQNNSNKNAKVNLNLSKTTGLESIPKHAFLECTGLTNIEIPSTVTSIGDYAFVSCTRLTSIKIPEGVTSIGEGAFFECIGLKSIEIPASLTNIGLGVFCGCRNVTSLYVENNNKGYQAFNNCLYTKDGQTLICVFGNPSTISFLQSITIIDNYAFEHCTNLTTIKIPKSITSIGSFAFRDCRNLTTIEIPESVTSIGSYAFDYCINLTNIEIPTSVTSIGVYAFHGCTNLTYIKIPESVTSIGKSAFYDCKNLTTVNYMGTIEQWNSISIDNYNYNLTSAKIICTDGVINE